ncbi:DNA ligase [Mycena kentingensis (nom. inval.)]|nr:DNA ligase [Mycena kentingensis (nom. inval.)]
MATSHAQLKHDQDDDYPSQPSNHGSVPFHVLAGLFDRLHNQRKHDIRRKAILGWFNHWRDNIGYDLYPVLRLILPQKDRERPVYGLKEKALAKAYIKSIPLANRDPDAIRLLNWKKPTEQHKSSGDFPTVLYDVISKRTSVVEGSLTVDELNGILDELARNNGKKYHANIMRRIYNNCTAEEQRWIARIILKDMVISAKETTVFSVFHPDAQDLYNTCSDLKKVAWQLCDPDIRLNTEDKSIKLCAAFAPMLCKRPTKTIEMTVREMEGNKFIIEEKLDGERMQIHKRGNEYFYCSRKGKDYTYLYGKHVGEGSLTPWLASAFKEEVTDIILDGEMLVWDPVSQRNLPFGTLKTAALDRTKKENNPRPCFKVFDLLYLNGTSLLEMAVRARKRNLKNCVREIKGRVEYATEYEGTTAKDVRARLDEVMESRGEGLVIKHPKAKYILNGRNNDWIKVKPEYMDNMGETMDLLVVGGNYGSGNRGGGVSTLICAVLDDRRQSTDMDEDPKYSSFCRIGSGLSFSDYIDIRKKPWKPWDPKNPPAFLQTAKKSHEDKGDVYLNPEDSFILKVKAAEIVPSGLRTCHLEIFCLSHLAQEQYHMAFTMRFPRALSVRHDLDIADCMPATAVLESMRTVKKRKADADTGGKKKRKVAGSKKIEVLASLGGTKLADVEAVSSIFNDMTFHVMPNTETKAGANGGTNLASHLSKPELVVYSGSVDKKPLPLTSLINKGKYDIIKPKWIEDSIAQGEKAPLQKKYFIHATEARKNHDEYTQDGGGDEDVNMNEPEAGPSMSTIKEEKDVAVKAEEHDPAFAGWYRGFEVHDNKKEDDSSTGSETETDADSDNDDTNEPGVDDEDSNNLEDPKHLDRVGEHQDTDEDRKVEEVIKMGETDDAMEYDQNLIFRHLVFYLDSPTNARENGMAAKPKAEEDIAAKFSQIASIITKNGGKVVELDDPKLTHVIVDKRDTSRRGELRRRTSKPKHRYLVISEFIEECIAQSALVDEDDFNA